MGGEGGRSLSTSLTSPALSGTGRGKGGVGEQNQGNMGTGKGYIYKQWIYYFQVFIKDW